jgi:hypothetical protein
MKKLKLLVNIGSVDAKKLGLKETREGQTVSVDDKFVDIMLKNGWASPEGKAPVRGAGPAKPLPERMPDDPAALLPDEEPGTVTEEGEAEDEGGEESPLSDSNATDAIEQISRMRSQEKLQHVIDNDPRSTVKDAARKRLADL